MEDCNVVELFVDGGLFGVETVGMIGQRREFFFVAVDHLFQDFGPNRWFGDGFGFLQFCCDFWRDGGVVDAGEQEFEDAVLAGLVLILAIVEREMWLV